MKNQKRSANTSAFIFPSLLVYEAGKAAKAGYPPPVTSIPGPYYIPTVPVGSVPSHTVLMEKSHLPPLASSESSAGGQSGNLKMSCVFVLGFSTISRNRAR